MGRKSGFTGILMAAARASAKAARQAEADRRKDLANRQRQAKISARELAKNEKENAKREKQEYLEMRMEEATDLTMESSKLYDYILSGIIPETLEIDDKINFETLKPSYQPPQKNIPPELTKNLNPPIENDFIDAVGKRPLFSSVIKSIRISWENRIKEAKQKYQNELNKWKQAVNEQKQKREAFEQSFQKEKEKYDSDYTVKCDEIEEFKSQYFNFNEEAVVSYVSAVLERSDYTIDWDREFKIAYSTESKELLIEYNLPTVDLIPIVSEYKYVKSKDTIEEKQRKKNDIELCYKYLICNIAIRTIHEIVESDQANAVSIICFNGYVNCIDKGTGKSINPTIISVSVSKVGFEDINLKNVDPVKCIQNFSARVSSSPLELVAVKPMKEYSMIDKRFVTEQDIASTLDNRSNLMDLNPFEFENLVSNLFSKMGLETKQTRTSKDGGVDAIAFDTRPVLGGKLVIQAKRYKNTVGVSAVRDLYGTMINEGASKGILVSTSSYGPDAYTFSRDKPIELIDGRGLLYLLDSVGIKSKILIADNF